MNFGWKSLRLFLGVFVICGFMSACRFELRPFNPKYFKEQQHVSIHFPVKTGKGLDDPTKAELHSGPAPYHPGGDTLVVYKNKRKKEIGRYAIANPTKVRSCELAGTGGGHIDPLSNGVEVELFFPPLPKTKRKIHYVEITFSYTDPRVRFVEEFNVSKILKDIYGK